MAYLTKKQEREQFLAEFLRRLREAPPGTRVYMQVGDVFKDADVVGISELRAAREAALVRDDDDGKEEDASWCRPRPHRRRAPRTRVGVSNQVNPGPICDN